MSAEERDSGSEPSIEQRDEFGPVPAEWRHGCYRLHFSEVDGVSIASDYHLVADEDTATEERTFTTDRAVSEDGTVPAIATQDIEVEVGKSLCGQTEVYAQDDDHLPAPNVCKGCLRVLKSRFGGEGDD